MTHYCDSSRYRNPQNVNPQPGRTPIGPGVGEAPPVAAACGARALTRVPANSRRGDIAARQHERVHSEVDLLGRRWPRDVWIVLRILAPVEHPVVTDDANLSMSQLFLPISCYGCGVVRVCPGLEQNRISRFENRVEDVPFDETAGVGT